MVQSDAEHRANWERMLKAMEAPLEKSKRIKAMLYGNSGVGKSVIAGAIAKRVSGGGRILYVDTSEGYVSLQNHKGLLDNVTVLPFTTLEDLETLTLMLNRGHSSLRDVKTVIFDEVSKMLALDLTRIAQAARVEVPEWPHYNQSANRFKAVVDNLYQNKDINVILLAHERDKKNKAGLVSLTHADFIPSILKVVKEELHLVARITAKNISGIGDEKPTYERQAQCHPTAVIDAKCRVTDMPLSVDARSLPKVIGKWLESGGTVREEVTLANSPGDEDDPAAAESPKPGSVEEMLDTAAKQDETDNEPEWVPDND